MSGPVGVNSTRHLGANPLARHLAWKSSLVWSRSRSAPQSSRR